MRTESTKRPQAAPQGPPVYRPSYAGVKAPPIYRPQQATAGQARAAQSGVKAPPVYRPQQASVSQPRGVQSGVKAPPVYRPQQPTVGQPRAAQAGVKAPPVYRPVRTTAGNFAQGDRPKPGPSQVSRVALLRPLLANPAHVASRASSAVQRAENSTTPKDIHSVFEASIRVGAEKLGKVGFANTEKEESEGRTYDKRYWTYSHKKETFTLKEGKSAAQGIASPFLQPGKWDLDCAEYTVFCRYYALLKTLTPEEFDKAFQDKRLVIDSTSGTGLKSLLFLDRDSKDESFVIENNEGKKYTTSLAPKTAQQEDRLLANVPIGWRVMWTDAKAHEDDDFKNENALKVGPDLYAAHPFGVMSARELRDSIAEPQITPHKFTDSSKFTAEQKKKLEEEDDEDPTDFITDMEGFKNAIRDYADRNVFLSQLEPSNRTLSF